MRRGERMYYSPREYAELTGMRENTIRKQLREGRLRGRRYGGRWRVLASELSRREKTAAPSRGGRHGGEQ